MLDLFLVRNIQFLQ